MPKTRASDSDTPREVQATPGGQSPRPPGARRRSARSPAGPRTWNPTAQRILAAAHQLLEQSSVDALSMDAVAQKAKVNKRLIFYYFGSKAGFMEALADWIFHDELDALRLFYSSVSQGDERARAVAEGHQEMLSEPDARRRYQVYLDMAVHMLRDPKGRARLAGMLATYRQLNAWGLSGDAPASDETRALSAMALALNDGLALQSLADEGSVDSRLIWQLWEEIADAVMRRNRA